MIFDDIGLGGFIVRKLILGGVLITSLLGLSIYYFKKYYKKSDITLKRLALLAGIVIVLFLLGSVVGGLITTIRILMNLF